MIGPAEVGVGGRLIGSDAEFEDIGARFVAIGVSIFTSQLADTFVQVLWLPISWFGLIAKN